MGQYDYVLISPVLVSLALIPKVWDKSEDFGRDPVDWCDSVSPGPNQAEDFGNALLENIELNSNTCQSKSVVPFRFIRCTSALSGVVAILRTRIQFSDTIYFTAPNALFVKNHAL